MIMEKCTALLENEFDIFRRNTVRPSDVLAFKDQLVHLELDDNLRVRVISVFYNGAGNLDHWIRCDNMGICPHQCLVRILENGEEAIKEESPFGVV